jgi:5-methylcytosine-specific restriction endonuclease McrA
VDAVYRRTARNKQILGDAEDLHAFLFGTERASLAEYVSLFVDVQKGACFYCERPLRKNAGHVDHFIPWTRYPVDLAHNFVVAHRECNEAKSNLLAAHDHLARWVFRNRYHATALKAEFNAKKLFHDVHASTAVTRWAYTIAEQSGSKVWRGPTRAELVHLDPGWRMLAGL